MRSPTGTSISGPARGRGHDLSVPLPLDDAQMAELERDVGGSNQADYVHGLGLFQRGQRVEALPFLRRADDQGHPEAPFLMAEILTDQGDEGPAAAALSRAEQRGSLWAPFFLAAAAEAGDQEAATRLQERAVGRAKAADQAGSADGAYLCAASALSEGGVEGALRQLRRADERGSVYAAYARAQLAAQLGRLPEATEAAERCAAWAMAAPTLLLGDLWYRRRRFARARRAWRRARAEAESHGDAAVRDAASSRLHPGPVEWLSSHPIVSGVAVLAAVVLLVAGRALWALAAVGWTAVLLTGPCVDGWLGPRIPVTDDVAPEGALPALSAGGLTVAGGPIDDDISPVASEDTIATRPTTERDYSYLHLLPWLVGLLAAALTTWAAELFGGSTMLRIFFGWLALVELWHTAWRAPDVLNPSPRDEASPTVFGGVQVKVRIGLSRFFSIYLHGELGYPPLMGAIALLRETSIEDCPVARGWARVSAWLSLVGMLLTAAFFAAEAVVPEQKALAGLALAVLAMVVVGGAALRGFEELLHGLFRRMWGSVVTGAGRVAVIAVLVLVSYWVGLLDAWVDAWRWLV